MNKDNEFSALKAREWSLYSERGDFFTRWFGLPVSLSITKVFLKLGLNENHASGLMLITGLIGAGLMILGPWGIFFGASFLVLHHLLDYVDGQIARHYGRASVHGAVLDRWNHFVVETTTFPCLAYGLYLNTDQIWPWIAVWVLYIWNRFRVLLAQLPANILSDELSQYPAFEREMMRTNLRERQASVVSSKTERAASSHGITKAKNKSRFRSIISRARVASTSYNGFTMLLWCGAALDLLAQHFFSKDGTIEALTVSLTVYAVFNILDYSWTYIRSDRVARELSSRLKSASK
jgi:hypothetical protein